MCTNVESCYRKKGCAVPTRLYAGIHVWFHYVGKIMWKYTSTSTCNIIWRETRCSQPLALCYQTCLKRHERLGIPGRVFHVFHLGTPSSCWVVNTEVVHTCARRIAMKVHVASVWPRWEAVETWDIFVSTGSFCEITLKCFDFWQFFFLISDIRIFYVCLCVFLKSPFFFYLAAGSTGMSMLTYTEGGWMFRRRKQDNRHTISDQNYPGWLFYNYPIICIYIYIEE